MQRIFPEDPASERAGRTIQISAARGEVEWFQIGVRARIVPHGGKKAIARFKGPGSFTCNIHRI
jgi:hypothetical protein